MSKVKDPHSEHSHRHGPGCAMRQCPMATIRITWWTATCTIPMLAIVMTMFRCSKHDGTLFLTPQPARGFSPRVGLRICLLLAD